MELLENHLPQILEKEKQNHSAIHLYSTGPYWVAFEQSAYLLHRLHSGSETTVLQVSTQAEPVIMASIPAQTLNGYATRHMVKQNAQGLTLLTASSLSVYHYRKWRQEELEDYL